MRARWYDNANTFLDQAEEAVETLEIEEQPKAPVGEICLLSSPSIMISFEMEVGRETIPLLVMEASLRGQVKDWSSDVSLIFLSIIKYIFKKQ